MKDISGIFEEVLQAETLWSVSGFFEALERLEAAGFGISFEQENENWATVLHQDAVVAYIWRKYPLIAAEAGYADELKRHTAGMGPLCFLIVDSLKEDLLTLDTSLLPAHIQWPPELGSQPFTMQDLWFYTVK